MCILQWEYRGRHKYADSLTITNKQINKLGVFKV
jgi:hypothetical protein